MPTPISYDPTLPPGIRIAGNAAGVFGAQNSVAWSPDGKRFATGGDDGSVRVWGADFNLLMVLWGHNNYVNSIAWSPDGKHLASASFDKTIRIWDSTSGESITTLQGHRDSVRSVAWSPDGNRLASASFDRTVQIWDSTSGASIATLKGHSGFVFSVAWSPDGTHLASASSDRTVRIWNSASGASIATLKGHNILVFSVAWSPDGTRLASTSNDGTVRIWDSTSGASIATLKGHNDSVLSVAWSPDSTHLASASSDRTVQIWDSASGASIIALGEHRTLRGYHVLQGHSDSVLSVAWSPDGKHLASASSDGTVRIWNSASGASIATLKGHSNSIRSITWSPEGNRLASASYDKTIRIWDSESGACIATLHGHSDFVRSIAWSPNSTRLASASSDKTVRIWDSESGKSIATLHGHSDSVRSVAWSPDGNRLASTSSDKTIRIWDSTSGELNAILRGHGNFVRSAAWSPDSNRLASASYDKTIRIWNSTSGELNAILRGHSDFVLSVAWSPDSNRLASASSDKTIRIWDSESGACIATLHGHSDFVNSVTWSPDGHWLLSSSNNETLLWRIAPDGEATLRAELPEIRGAVFAQNSLRFASLRGFDNKGNTAKAAPLWFLLNAEVLSGTKSPTERLSTYYNNAKVVLVGDTGVGKTGLSTVLCGKPFAESEESTHGRKVHLLHEGEETLPDNAIEKREVLLWDLAGQPGYRLVHQLHLHEVAVALVVFDARNETDPLGAVLYWNRALEQSRIAQGEKAPPFVKILVSARTDRGSVAVSQERIQKLMRDNGFTAYFETSAKEGQNIEELGAAALKAIDWTQLQKGTTTLLFERIQKFLLERQQAGLLLSTPGELRYNFGQANPEDAQAPNFEDKFDTNIALLERRDLLRRFSYGDLVLLQPEYLDAYASSIIEAAKDEPDGLGDIALGKIYDGTFKMSESERLADRAQEKLLLPAVVEDFYKHDLAIKDGEQLVFPSQVTREHQDYPEPAGQTVVFTFEGPLANIYATLAVRLARSGQFKRSGLWKNAATYAAVVGGECGFYQKETEPGKADLGLFFDCEEGEEKGKAATEQTRFTFEQFVAEHLEKHAVPGSVHRHRSFACDHCGELVPPRTAQKTRARGKYEVECAECGEIVSLFDGLERLHTHSAAQTKNVEAQVRKAVEEMNETADEAKEVSAATASLKGEIQAPRFKAWFGPDQFAHVAIVFTDLVGSTKLGKDKGDYAMGQLQERHFAHVRRLLAAQNGYELQTAGDSFLVVFKSTPAALDFALSLRRDAGAPELSLRASLHCGQVFARADGAFGTEINYAHRVMEQAIGAELWISNDAYRAIDNAKLENQTHLKWEQHTNALKDFSETETVWQLIES